MNKGVELVGGKTVPPAQDRRPGRRLCRLWEESPPVLVRSDRLYNLAQVVHVVSCY